MHALATLSSMFKINKDQEIPLIENQRRDKPIFYLSFEEEPDGKPRFHNIKCYIKNQEYPIGIWNRDKKTLIRLASKFFINGDVHYKRNHDIIILRCVDKPEANFLIKKSTKDLLGLTPMGTQWLGKS